MCTSNLAGALTTATGSGGGTVGGYTSLGLGIASGIFSASSAVTGANNTITADNAQGDALATNALIEERAAASAVEQGQAQAANVYMRGAQVQGAQRAAAAANGVDVNTGSAAALQASTDYITNRDADTVTANAARAAMGYTQQQQNDLANAGQYYAAGSRVSPFMAGATSLLGSATSVASTWYRNQRVGA